METIILESDIAREGRQIYHRLFSLLTSVPENIGKIVAIDPKTGDYAIDADLLQAVARLRVRHPEANPWSERIGYNAVFAVGGSLFPVDANDEPIER